MCFWRGRVVKLTTMWTSAKELLRRVVGHWIQALAGTGGAILGLIADIQDWNVPPNVWIAASALMFLWAILCAFHDVRLDRDIAMDIRDYQRIADRLTEMYQEGIGSLNTM